MPLALFLLSVGVAAVDGYSQIYAYDDLKEAITDILGGVMSGIAGEAARSGMIVGEHTSGELKVPLVNPGDTAVRGLVSDEGAVRECGSLMI